MPNTFPHYHRRLFRHLFADLPPLTPLTTVQAVEAAWEKLKKEEITHVREMEEIMVSLGKALWPERRAFRHFFEANKERLGEDFFLQRASARLKKRYREFVAAGGTFLDIYRGRHAHFFSQEERSEAGPLFVEIRKALRDYTKQSVLTTERQLYEERIEEYRYILSRIEERLIALRRMASMEEHDHLREEILAHVEGFEHSLAGLSHEIDYQAVGEAEAHFLGRKEERKRFSHLTRFFV